MGTQSILLAAGFAALVVGCAPETEPAAPPPESEASAPAPPPATALPQVIVAERGRFIPEGVEYDQANGRLLVGSLRGGTVFQLHADGRLTPVAEDPELVSSIGIEVDEPRDRLLVANSDASIFRGGGRGQAKLGVFNLTTGERIAMVDLAAALEDAPEDAVFFANDLTVDDRGSVYVSDSRLGVIYRVDSAYRASLLHRFAPTEDFAPNGLVYHPSGYLLVAGGVGLYKVPLDDPASARPVTLAEPVPGPDGVVWMADGRLAIVANRGNRVVALTSDDDWASAEIAGIAAYSVQATTAAVVGDDLYVVHPHFSDDAPPSVERVSFR